MNNYLKKHWYSVQEPEDWFTEQDNEYIQMDMDAILENHIPKLMTPYDLMQIYQTGVLHIYLEMLANGISIDKQAVLENSDILIILADFDKLGSYRSEMTKREAIQLALEIE